MFQNDDVPRVVGVACCGQFAVSKSQVRSRPKSSYERFQRWLPETPLDDSDSGRVLEYMWHIIWSVTVVVSILYGPAGGGPAHVCSCPDLETCYCDVYGQCKG